MKIGIYGGSFDPIHLGHMQVAETVIESKLVDRIMFLPSYNPEHKEITTSFDNRCHMIDMSISDHPNYMLSYDEYEIFKQKLYNGTKPYVYTLDVLNYFNKRFPDDEYSFIMGSDSWHSIHKWYQYENLLKATKFIVVSRHNELHIRNTDVVTFLDIKDKLDISSTKIRDIIKCVDPQILKYYLECKGN